jgi:hypothetical protein
MISFTWHFGGVNPISKLNWIIQYKLPCICLVLLEFPVTYIVFDMNLQLGYTEWNGEAYSYV